MNKNLPVVTIIGRPNVGKSSLFNRLLGERKAIVDDIAGTTRDRVEGIIEWRGRKFWLVDTAGLQKDSSELGRSVRAQIDTAQNQADIILLVVDGSTILSDEDNTAIKLSRKSSKPVVVAVNKADRASKQLVELDKLPGERPVKVSAVHGTGSGDLLDVIIEKIAAQPVNPDSDVPVLALLGRPNVGKSSLLNEISGKDRAVVSANAGTTRDTTEITIEHEGQTWQVLDTAGLRRKSKASEPIEYFSSLRTINAINSSDVCALVLDATELVTAQDKRIAGMVKEAGKSLVLVVNKWDETKRTDQERRRLEGLLVPAFQFVWWAPLLLTSATEKHNVNKLVPLAGKTLVNRRRKITTAKLNRILQQTVDGHPPAGLKNRHPKLNYITQTDIEPPTFTVFGSQTPFLHWSYKRHLETQIRQEFDFTGTPLRFKWRDKHDQPAGKAKGKRP